jgi:hypothetical protein
VAADARPSDAARIVVGDRVVPRSAYRPSPWAEVADTPAWWGALALVGGLLVLAGGTAVLSSAEATAIGGVLLFFVTAVAAGRERAEWATGLAVSALVWTSTGIALASGADGAPYATLFALVVAGLVLALVGGTRTLFLFRAGASRA